MDTYLFHGTQAFEQVGLFIGALACLGLGGFILGNSLYSRLHALHVTGTIIGVVARGGMYTPVYRYTAPDGQTHEAKSDTSSNSTRGKETGRAVPLLISPHNPAEAREANSHLFDAIGLVLIMTGVWLGYTALTAYPVTWMTWLMAAVMVVNLAERGRRIFIAKGPRPSVAEWRARHGLDAAGAIDPAAVTPIETITGTPEAQRTLQMQVKNNRRTATFVGLCAVALLAIGIFQAQDIARLQSSGLRAQGEVVRLKGEMSSGRDPRYNYFPIVRYYTDKNVAIEFKDTVGSNPPSYRPGDKVTVIYRADDPRGDAIIDRGPLWNWAIPALLLLGAALLAWLMMWMRRRGASSEAVGTVAGPGRG